ncbi:MAG: outer membrane protein assembly factor BamD [Bacteroidota bacterium]
MGKIAYQTVLAVCLLAVVSFGCRSEYEKVRTSGDPALILEKALAYYEEEEYQRAQSLFELVAATYRGRKEAEEIAYKNAYCYYYLRSYLLSSYQFKQFVQTYGTSPKREEAEFMSAYSNYKLSPKFRLDQSSTYTAIQELQFFINTYPNSERVTQCNELIDELRAKLETKAFDEGQLYFDRRLYTASIQVYENLLKDFPETKQTDRVRSMIVKSEYLLAENSVLQKQEERYRITLNMANESIDRFPESEYVNEIKKIREDADDKIKQLQ